MSPFSCSCSGCSNWFAFVLVSLESSSFYSSLPSNSQTTYMFSKYCFLHCSLFSFSSFNRTLLRIKVYNSDKAPFLSFFFGGLCFGANSKNTLPSPRAQRHSHMVFLLQAVQSMVDCRDWCLNIEPVSHPWLKPHWLMQNYATLWHSTREYSVKDLCFRWCEGHWSVAFCVFSLLGLGISQGCVSLTMNWEVFSRLPLSEFSSEAF